MPNYKEMYLTMLRASKRATDILIAAQQECEEHYISLSESESTVILLPIEDKKDMPENIVRS